MKIFAFFSNLKKKMSGVSGRIGFISLLGVLAVM